MGSPLIRTPLNQASFEIDGFSVAETGFINKLNLRGRFESAAANQALSELLGMDCQLAPNKFVSSGGHTLFWLGPNERLLYTEQDPSDLADRWRQSAGAAEVSDYYTVLSVSGSKARAVLASGSPFDLHPGVFAVGDCTQTRFGNASVLISQHADTPVFQVQVRWSFAEYVMAYMQRVARYV